MTNQGENGMSDEHEFGVVDQRTLGSYNRALKRLRKRYGREFRQLLDEERAKDKAKIGSA